MYDIICYCSSTYQKALLKFLPSWLDQNPDQIHIYCSHELLSELPLEIVDNPKIEFYPEFEESKNRGINCARKTEALKLHMNQFTKPLILLDVDCLLINDISHVFNRGDRFDIGVTVDPRVKGTKALRDISTGVLFLNDTPVTKTIIQEWLECQKTDHNPMREQRCFSRMIRQRFLKTEVELKFLSRDIYNAYPHTNTPKEISDWQNRLNKPLGLNSELASHVCVIHFPHKLWKQDLEVDAKGLMR